MSLSNILKNKSSGEPGVLTNTDASPISINPSLLVSSISQTASNPGNSDFAITIRTLFSEGNHAYIQVGACIVADSISEKEWFETDHKAKALMKALEHAAGGKTQ